MQRFEAEFAEFFEDPIVRKLLARDADGGSALLALKEEKERLWDVERLRAFKTAIAQNGHLLRGKVVLALRSALGLTAVWAARAGAARVVCVEDSPAIEFIRERVKAEGLAQVECVRAPPAGLRGAVDVILADWPGYFGLNQCFVYELIRVRDLCLRPGGAVLPDRLSFWAACFSDEAAYRARFGFWDDVYGLAMPSMKSVCFGEAVFERADPRGLVSQPRLLRTIDVGSVSAAELGFAAKTSLELRKRPAAVHGVVLWFDVAFGRCHAPVALRTSPHKNATDICNVKLFFRRPVRVDGLERVTLSVSARNADENVAQTQVGVAIEAGEFRHAQSFLLK